MFDSIWYRETKHPVTYVLFPAAFLFKVIVTIRRWLYRLRLLKTKNVGVPVIVVGNVTIGGTGKTPFVIWLAQWLKAQGFCPGIVSRGVGGLRHRKPYLVKPNDAPEKVGDEAILLANHSGCPVVVGVNRPNAANEILMHHCNIVISDDGLQHYRLGRDIEIAVLDGERRLGNQCLLPAGPLREPKSRLAEVDFVVVNGGLNDEFVMDYEPVSLVSLINPTQKKEYSDFPQKKIHAVAGIGHPQRFFNLLKKLGFEVIPHVFPDHYLYHKSDFTFTPDLPIIMTEKDAVKCRNFADQQFWYLTINARISDNFTQKLRLRLEELS